MNRPLLTRTAALAAGLTLVSTSAAWAAWTSAGTGSGTGKAMSLIATGSAATVAPTSSAIDVTFTTAGNPSGTTYTVTRNHAKDGTGGPQVACASPATSPCHDTGLTQGTSFSYTVTAVRSSWTLTGSAGSATTTSPTVTSPTTASPALVPKGTSGNLVVVTGTGFVTGITGVVTTSNGFSITAVAFNSSTQVTLTVTAPSGNNKVDTFKLTNADGSTVTCTGCLKSN